MGSEKSGWGIIRLAVLGLGLLISSSASGGQNDGLSFTSQTNESPFGVYRLGEVVVTSPKKQENSVAIVSRVDAVRMEETNSRTVPEALRYIPGVNVSMGRKNQPDVSVHGFDQSKVLVLIDGVPYYETNYGMLNLTQLMTDSVAEIKVVKGQPSVLYGPNAEGGVINIISRQAQDKPHFLALAETGEKDYYRFSASHGMKYGIINYWISYVHMEREAWKLSDDYEPVMGTSIYKPGGSVREVLEDGGFRDNSHLRTDNFGAKFGLQPDPGSEYFLNFHLIDSGWGLPASIYSNTVFPNPPAYSQYAWMKKYRDWGIDLTGRQEICEQLEFKLNLFYHGHEDTYVSFYDPACVERLSDSTYKDHLEGGAFFVDYSCTDWQSLRLAFHLRSDTHKQQDDSYLPVADSRSTTGSLALESESRLLNELALTLGCGYSWFDVVSAETVETNRDGSYQKTVDLETPSTNDSVTPMAGLDWRPAKQTRFFTSLGLTSRFPTLQQLYSSKSGNLSLDPEQSFNFLLGIEQGFGQEFGGEFSFFHHHVNDWIGRENRDYRYKNWGTITMTGFETGVWYALWNELELKLNYTLNYAQDYSSNRVTSDVVEIPLSKVDVGLTYILPRLETKLNLDAVYVSSIYTQLPSPTNPDLEKEKSDDYFLLGGRITQPVGEYGEVYLSAENILDLDYEPQYGFPGKGRTVWVGAKAVF